MLTFGRAESLLLLLSREPGSASPALPILGKDPSPEEPGNSAALCGVYPGNDPVAILEQVYCA